MTNDILTTLAKLPEHCYSTLLSTGETIAIKRGVVGYYAIHTQRTADYLNNVFGVTKAQAEAMMAGSMFGWEVPAADPDNYDEDGKWIK